MNKTTFIVFMMFAFLFMAAVQFQIMGIQSNIGKMVELFESHSSILETHTEIIGAHTENFIEIINYLKRD